jgi:hypothetical protein
MASGPSAGEGDLFDLTLRQRRLRMMTGIVLTIIAAMFFVGMTHPFFRPIHPAVLTEAVRRAIKVKALVIFLYWTACLLLTAALMVFALLDVREIRKKIAIARRDYWADIAQRSAERRGTQPAHDDSPNSS